MTECRSRTAPCLLLPSPPHLLSAAPTIHHPGALSSLLASLLFRPNPPRVFFFSPPSQNAQHSVADIIPGVNECTVDELRTAENKNFANHLPFPPPSAQYLQFLSILLYVRSILAFRVRKLIFHFSEIAEFCNQLRAVFFGFSCDRDDVFVLFAPSESSYGPLPFVFFRKSWIFCLRRLISRLSADRTVVVDRPGHCHPIGFTSLISFMCKR